MLRVFCSMKYLLFAFSALLLDIIGSCDDNYLRVNLDEVFLDSHGGNAIIEVSSNLEWKITGKDSWLDVSPTSGNGNAVINIIAQPNESIYGRSDTIIIKGDSWRAYEKIIVYQRGNYDFLHVNPHYVLFSNQGGSATIEVSSNVEWIITGKGSWLDVSPTSGNGNAVINITAQPNESTFLRDSYISIDGNGLRTYQTVGVYQEGKLATEDGR